jgi:hypothetical protein
MTVDELNSLRFNMPIHSNIDNSLWYYDCRNGNQVKIFKQLIETDYHELRGRGRSMFRSSWGSDGSPWRREGELVVPVSMILEDFELFYEIVEPDLELVKKDKTLMTRYSIVKPNFHMMNELPF